MKRYLFHLICAILLIVLLLLLFNEMQRRQKWEGLNMKLSRESSDLKLLLDNEREENKLLLEKERSENRQALETERKEAAAKEAAFETQNKDLQEKVAILEESISEIGRRFQIISTRDVRMLGLSFEQTPCSESEAATAVELADSLKDPTPAEFKEAAEKTLEPLLASSHELVLDADSGYVVDPVAAIVETAAKTAGLAASTTVFWDTSRKAFRSEVTVSDPAKKAKDAVVAIGGNKLFQNSVFQLSPKTTVFPFVDLSLFSRSGIDLFTRSASIPVGGLYVHYFRVYSKGPWILEYVFPENLEPESVNMNLLQLTYGSSITSTVMGRTFTFHVNVENLDAGFLVIADRPFFPDSVSIRLKQ